MSISRWFPDPSARLTRRQVVLTYTIAAGTIAGLLGSLLGCGGGKKSDLQVMSYAPQGPVDKAATVEIKFDKPVVDEAMVGKAADLATLRIEPAFAWKARGGGRVGSGCSVAHPPVSWLTSSAWRRQRE